MVIVGLGAGGCARVAPYERMTLATTRMRLDDPPGESLLVRGLWSAREEGHVGAGSNTAGGGGGCGCH